MQNNSDKLSENIDLSPANMQADFLGLPKIYTKKYIDKILKENRNNSIRTQNILIRHPEIEDWYNNWTDKEKAPLKNPKCDIDKIYQDLKKIIWNNQEEYLVLYSPETIRISELADWLKERGFKSHFIEDKNISTWDREEFDTPQNAILEENWKNFLEFRKKYSWKNIIVLTNSTFNWLYSASISEEKDKMIIDPNILKEWEIALYNFDEKWQNINSDNFLKFDHNNIEEIISVLEKNIEFNKIISDFKNERINLIQFTNSINLIFSKNKELHKKVLDYIVNNYNLNFSYKTLINFNLDYVLKNEKKDNDFFKNKQAVFWNISKTFQIWFEKIIKLFDILWLDNLWDFFKQIDNSEYKWQFISKIKNDDLDEKSKLITFYLSWDNSLYNAWKTAKENNFEIKEDVNMLKADLDNLFNSLFNKLSDPNIVKENLSKLENLINQRWNINIFETNVEEFNTLKDYLEQLFLEKFVEIIYGEEVNDNWDKIVQFRNIDWKIKQINKLEALENKFFSWRNNINSWLERYSEEIDEKQIFFSKNYSSVNNLDNTSQDWNLFFNNQKWILKSQINHFYEVAAKQKINKITWIVSYFEFLLKEFRR